MASSSNTVFIVVGGSWHPMKLYEPLVSTLQKANYLAEGVELPSNGYNPPVKSWDADVDAIREKIQVAVDQGKDVVLLVHSYGGLPGSEAVKGFTKAERKANNLQGGVTRMIYMCAFALEEGHSLLGGLGGNPPAWTKLEGDRIYSSTEREIFYNDLPAELAEENKKSLVFHAFGVWKSEVTYAAWKHVPVTYILAEKDNALLPSIQQSMIEMIEGVNEDFRAIRCDASHSFFITQPEVIINELKQLFAN